MVVHRKRLENHQPSKLRTVYLTPGGSKYQQSNHPATLSYFLSTAFQSITSNSAAT